MKIHFSVDCMSWNTELLLSPDHVLRRQYGEREYPESEWNDVRLLLLLLPASSNSFGAIPRDDQHRTLYHHQMQIDAEAMR